MKRIIETWGFYSKDPVFLNSVMNNTGRHYRIVQKELIKHELELKFRHKLLAQSEFLIFKRAESDKIKYAEDLKKIGSLFNRLKVQIKGYYKLSPGTKFRETALIKLKKELLLKLIKSAVTDLNRENILKVMSWSRSYLDSFESISDVEVLDELLAQKNFFNSNDLKVFYLKQLLNYKTGQLSKMISDTEGFRNSVTFIKEGQESDMVKLLTLLTDAYINSRLLTKAMDILKEIEKISPGLMCTYWRLIRVEGVIGKDESFKETREEKFEQIRNSNNILINKTNIKNEVYPFEIDKLILNPDESFSDKFREHHLLQVFVNGQIFYESYIGELKFPVELPLPDELKKEKFDVEINLIK